MFWIGKVPDKMNDKFKFCFPQHTKFLVTGGAGFIGSNLVEKILDLGYRVRVLDNFFTGRKENLNPFLLDPGFELIEGDLRNANDCQRSCMGIDYVLHQAALGSVFRSIEDPLPTNEINITGTLNLLIAAREQGVKRFIYASSSGDIQKAERILGYAPDRPVEEGLRLTIDWYKAEANN